MKKSLTLFLVAAVALVSGLLVPKSAEALPAFARQVGQPCYACHYQHIPQLNSFGREFKLGGMTQSAQDQIQDENLSIGTNLNAAVMVGSTISLGSTTGMNGNNTGNWAIGNDASLFAGGRIGQDLGALIEFSGKSSGFDAMKTVYSHDFGGIQGGLVLYRTGGGGPAYSMDLYNTGSNTNNFGWDSPGNIFINQAAGPESGVGAEGLHVVAGNSLFFVNVGLFAPVGDNLGVESGANVGLNFSQYYRLAVTPKVVDGLDLMIGVQGTSGTTQVDMAGGTPLKVDTQSLMIDAQAQFELMGQPAQVTAVWGTIPSKMGAGSNNVAAAGTFACASAAPSPYCNAVYNPGQNDISGFDLTASWSINKMSGVEAVYGSISNVAGSKFNLSGFGLGGWVDVAQNVHIAVEEIWYSGDTGANQLNQDSTSTTIELRLAF